MAKPEKEFEGWRALEEDEEMQPNDRLVVTEDRNRTHYSEEYFIPATGYLLGNLVGYIGVNYHNAVTRGLNTAFYPYRKLEDGEVRTTNRRLRYPMNKVFSAALPLP